MPPVSNHLLVIVELINTGSELMLGRVLNTHQQWLCRRLADLGYIVSRQLAVPDTADDIQNSVREALCRADLIITTGGLGPTSDDLTRELIAKLLNKKLLHDDAILNRIKTYFESRGRRMPENTEVQAFVPEGAIVLENRNGTAPGLAMRIGPGVLGLGSGKQQASERLSPDPRPQTSDANWLIMLPGPPRELRPMFDDIVVPLLKREFPTEAEFVCRTLKTTGVGESIAQQTIEPRLRALVAAGLEIGYCARIGAVDVRLAVRGAKAKALVSAAESIVRGELAAHIYGEDDDTLEAVIVGELTERRQTLTLAESCTGGAIAHHITNVPGASAVFLGGFVTYSNAMKEKFLGVCAETLAAHGAVSEAVAREMADGARRQTGADFAIAVTGIAGPGGGTAEKPAGTVFIALASAQGTEVWRMFNPWERETFKEVTGQQALNQLRLRLLK